MADKSYLSKIKLSASTLVSNCYARMFSGCTSIMRITALFITTPSTAYTAKWVAGVPETSSGVCQKKF